MKAAVPSSARETSAPFNLIRYFFLTSLLLIALVAVAITYIAAELATRSIVDQKQREGVNIARNLSWQIFSHIVAMRGTQEPNTADALLAIRDIPELDTFIRERTLGLGVEKVSIIDRSGNVLYSTDPATLSVRGDERTGYETALGGRAWAGLEHTLLRGLDGAERLYDVVEVYSPIRSIFATDQSDEIVGVFELYLNVGNEFAPQVAEAQQRAVLVGVGAMGLMFVGLLLIVLRADRVIRSSHQQLSARGIELRQLSEENARLYAMTRSRRLDEQSALLDFSQALLQTLDPQAVFDKSVRTMLDLVPARSATLWIADGSPTGRTRVQLAAEVGWPLECREAGEDSLPARVIQQQRMLESARSDENAFACGAQLHAALGVPMLVAERTIGALVVFRAEGESFESDDVRLLNLVANQTALALEQAQLYQTALERRRFAESLTRLGVVINATLNLQTVLDIVCGEAINYFDVTTAIIWQAQEHELVCVAARGLGHEHYLGIRQRRDDPLLFGARVIREQRPAYINQAEDSPQVKQTMLNLSDGKAIMGVPFFKGDQPLGAMVLIDSVMGQRFNDEDVARANAFGQQAAIAIHNAQLYEQTQSQAIALANALLQLELTYDATLAALSAALDTRDRETEGHSRRVTAFTLELARVMGVPAEQMETLERGALLHDIGKIGIPDAILRKPGALTDEEWQLMREHPRLGEEMLKAIPFLSVAVEIVSTHQERYDGKGYPYGLAGEQIPLGARIFAVADALDAMLSDRPYRRAKGYEFARSEIVKHSGTQFDPSVVEAFLLVPAARWEELRERVAHLPDLRVRNLVFGEELRVTIGSEQ